MENEKKKVSILIPCRNEAQYIERCIQNIYDFEPPYKGFEVIIIDGMSNDGTRDKLLKLQEKYNDLVIVDNPKKTVPHAMNLGIQLAQGEYIVRTDVRCIHPKSYLNNLIELSERTGADNVGGVLVPMAGTTYIEKSIALAYKSPIAMGGALRERGNFVGETDTVYGGFFKRERLLEAGMYDEEMVRNQDDELSFRLRKMGGKIIQDSHIKIQYYPRKYYRHVFKQFLQYGYWKVAVIKKHPQQASVRHFLPALLVLGFITFTIAALFHRYAFQGLLLYALSYFVPVSLESFRLAYKADIKLWLGIIAAISLIHISFGIGFLLSLVCRLLNIKPKFFETLSR